MDKKFAGLLGAVAGVATLGGAAHATPATAANVEPMAAHSYADLLAPVPDALTALKADDAARANQPQLQLANSVVIRSDHHHHHHHHHARHRVIVIKHHRHHHHHHHHHHHANSFIGIPGVGGVVVHSDSD